MIRGLRLLWLIMFGDVDHPDTQDFWFWVQYPGSAEGCVAVSALAMLYVLLFPLFCALAIFLDIASGLCGPLLKRRW